MNFIASLNKERECNRKLTHQIEHKINEIMTKLKLNFTGFQLKQQALNIVAEHCTSIKNLFATISKSNCDFVLNLFKFFDSVNSICFSLFQAHDHTSASVALFVVIIIINLCHLNCMKYFRLNRYRLIIICVACVL